MLVTGAWKPQVGEFVTWPKNGVDGVRVVGCVLGVHSDASQYWDRFAEMVSGEYVATMFLFRKVPLSPLSAAEAHLMLSTLVRRSETVQ